MTPQEAVTNIIDHHHVTLQAIKVLYDNPEIIGKLSTYNHGLLREVLKDFLIEELILFPPSNVAPRIMGISWKLFHDQKLLREIFIDPFVGETRETYPMLKILNEQSISTEEEACVITELINIVLTESDTLDICRLVGELKNKYPIRTIDTGRNRKREGDEMLSLRRKVTGRRRME